MFSLAKTAPPPRKESIKVLVIVVSCHVVTMVTEEANKSKHKFKIT